MLIEAEHRRQVAINRRRRPHSAPAVQDDHIVRRRTQPTDKSRHVIDLDRTPLNTGAFQELEPQLQTRRIRPLRIW